MKFVTSLSKSNLYYLDQAVELAKLSTEAFKHGAIIRKAGNTVAVGINYTINDPAYLEDEIAISHAAIHAEIAALNAARKVDLNGATIYVARVIKNGELRMSKPCENCQAELINRGVKKVIYTVESSMNL